MSNSLTRIIGEYVLAPAAAVGITLLSATAFADDGVQGGTFVPGGQQSVAAPAVPGPVAPVVPGAPTPARPARKRAAAPAVRVHEHPHTHADYEAELQRLDERVNALQKRTGEDYSALQGAIDSLSLGVAGLDGRQDALAERQGGLERGQEIITRAQVGLLESLQGLVERLEGYEELKARVDDLHGDQALGYMRTVFRNGLTPEIKRLQGMGRSMQDICAEAYKAQQVLAQEESAIARETVSLADRINALANDTGLTTDLARAQKAIGMRLELEKRQNGLPARREKADAQVAHCYQATQRFDAAQRELEQRIRTNIFGSGEESRRIWLELGAQAGYRGAAAGAVVAAVTYRGDSVTVGLGGGLGYGGAVTDTSDLTQPAQSQPQGDYREESSMTGTETTTDHYRRHAQLRVGTPWARGRKWVPGVSGIVDLAVSDRDVAVARTRTSQLLDADNQPVGDAHEVSCGTEENDACSGSGSKRSYGVAPGIAVDLFRDGNRDGYAMGVRGTVQLDVDNRRPDFTLSLLGTF